MQGKITPYDCTSEFESEIKPKINELKKVCNRLKIPMYVSVCYKNNKKESTYYNDTVGSWSNGVILTTDLLPDYMNVQNGFRTVPPQEEEEVDMDIFTGFGLKNRTFWSYLSK
jgi:hypothetical protein